MIKLATRVMRARRESLCPHCAQPIRVGQVIAKTGMWMHVGRVIARLYDSTTIGGDDRDHDQG